MNLFEDEKLIETLSRGGVVVMPTDTIYGIVGQALDQETVKRIYEIKKRAPEKKCIILIGDWSETNKFGIDVSQFKIPEYEEPTSFIIENIAFRVPVQAGLRDLLKKTGPLIVPSANPEGLPPAENIAEAKNYFGDEVDLYIDGGTITGKASKLIKLHKDGSVSILRE
ncbi:MAG: L-threonylcarbamoyladenylate synthase [Candidatus Paceibacterota bacterium]